MNKGFTKLSLLVGMVFIMVVSLALVGSVFATSSNQYNTNCHYSSNNVDKFQNKGMHFTSPNCDGPTATPTMVPTATPTLIPSPTINPCIQVEYARKIKNPCVTPTITPSVSPTVTPEVKQETGGSSPDASNNTTGAPGICTNDSIGTVGGIYVAQGVINDGKLEVRWWKPANADKVHIFYTDGKPGEWRYSLLNTDNDGSEVIGNLKNGTHYWFAVAGVSGCAVGPMSAPFDPIP